MRARQTRVPGRWMIVNERPGEELWRAVRRLPRGSGVLLLHRLEPAEMRRLNRLAALRGLRVARESPGAAARVHDVRELRGALLRRTALVLLSPIYPTGSHPDQVPLARMRAAALARLGRGKLLALGGMDARRFERVRRLGFAGWAGISAFRT